MMRLSKVSFSCKLNNENKQLHNILNFLIMIFEILIKLLINITFSVS